MIDISANLAPVLFTTAGLLVIIYGFFVAFKFRNTLGTGRIAEAWDKLIGLIAFFIFGYIAYLAQLISGKEFLGTDLMVSIIFLFGAVFVAATAYLNYDAYGI